MTLLPWGVEEALAPVGQLLRALDPSGFAVRRGKWLSGVTGEFSFWE